MQNKFECEVRLLNYTFEDLLKRIVDLGATKKLDYSFTDYYFKPNTSSKNTWDDAKTLRVREWESPKRPTAIYFSKNSTKLHEGISFKKSEYAEGKLTLFSGEKEVCFQLLNDLGFQHSVKIKKEKGQVWVLPDGFQIILEYVPDFGWTGEFELDGSDEQKVIHEILRVRELLQLDPSQISYKSMFQLFTENTV